MADISNLSDEKAAGATALLLAQREGRALRWTVLARVVFVGLGLGVALPIMASTNEVLAMSILGIVVLGAQLAIIWSLRKRPGAVSVGLLGTLADALVLCALPVIWHVVYTGENEPLAHLTRHNFTAVTLAVIALNGLALRPLYPALLTGVTVVLHLVLAWLAVNDPRLDQFAGGLDRALGIGFGQLDLIVVTPFFVGLAGVLITFAARAARATVREAVERQYAEYRLREWQIQTVLEAKMAAVGDLVAGVEHEINNPLGALHSAVDTADKAVRRLRADLSAGDGALGKDSQRALAALDRSLELTQQASQRLAGVMATIRGFVQLDRSELQRLDLAATLQNVLDIQQQVFRPDTRVAIDLATGVVVEGDPKRLAQALATVVRNAAEAFVGPGALAVRLYSDDEQAWIEIEDSGRGMTGEQIKGLFEIDFAHGERTHARFGLSLCRSIIHRHNGDINYTSQPGRGTKVTIRLPLAR